MIAGNVELVGVAILLGVVLQVAAGTYGAMRRRAVEAQRQQIALDLFRERAENELAVLKFERQRREHAWDGYRKFRIDRKVDEATNVCSFYLVPHDGMQLPPFRPGQFLTFQLRIPGQVQPVIRCYSLSDSPTQDEYYRCTIKRLPPPPAKPDAPPGLSSSYFHGLKEGDLLDVRAPAGNFVLDVNSIRPVVLIAGGIGLTPVLSMLNMICSTESRREAWFFYGIRHRGEHAMYDHLKKIAAEHDNVHIVACYSDPSDICREGEHYSVKGFVCLDLFKRMLPSNNYEFYVCGPPPMMESLTKGLREWGVPEQDIHFEAFGPATVRSAAADTSTAGKFATIRFARIAKTVDWRPNDGSILELADKHGIRLNFGCRAGNCGTCETAVREGKVSYIVETAFKPKEGSCLPCVAVPEGTLVLDA